MANVDPSGLSCLSKLFKKSLDPLGLGHSARVNWDDGRESIEIGLAVAACVAIDIASDGAAAGTNGPIMSAIAGGTAAVGGAAAATCVIGAAVGGALNGWKGAEDGALFALCLWEGTGIAMSPDPGAAAENAVGKAFTYQDPSENQLGLSMLKGAVLNSAFGSRQQGAFFQNFGYGAISGFASGAADDMCFNAGFNPLLNIPAEIGANRSCSLIFGNPRWGIGSFLGPCATGGLTSFLTNLSQTCGSLGALPALGGVLAD